MKQSHVKFLFLSMDGVKNPRIVLFPCMTYILQILSCGGSNRFQIGSRTSTKECYALSIGGNGDNKWTLYNSFTEDITARGSSLGPKSVFLPKFGTYIFSGSKSQFLPVGTKKWQKGNV